MTTQKGDRGSFWTRRASGSQHMVPFAELMNGVKFLPQTDEIQISYQVLRKFIRHTLRFMPFDGHFYRMTNSGFDSAFKSDDQPELVSHYQNHGYFEGRPPQLYHFPEMENEPLSNPIPNKYFELLRCSQDFIYDGKTVLSRDLLMAAVNTYGDGFHANYTLGNILFRGFDFLAALPFLGKAARLRPYHEKALLSFRGILNTLKDPAFSRRVLEKISAYHSSAPTWLLVDICRTDCSLQNYSKARKVLLSIRNETLTPFDQTTVGRVKSNLLSERRQLFSYKAKMRSKGAAPGEQLTALVQLARFGRTKLAAEFLHKLLKKPEFLPGLLPQNLRVFFELSDLLFGREDMLGVLDRMIAGGEGAPTTELLAMKIAFLSKAGLYRELLELVASQESLALDDELSSGVALAMLSEKSYINLATFCRQWEERAKDRYLPYNYLILATILSGEMKIVYLDRSIIHRELISKTGTNEISTNSIPRKIVQYWDKVVPPDDICQLAKIWAEQFGQENYELFNDDTARDFIRHYYNDDIVLLYDFCYHPAMKADLFRLLYLYRKGGYYVDADDGYIVGYSWLVRNTPNAKMVIVTGLQEHNGGPQHLTLNNLFIGTVPGHTIIGGALNHALKLLRAAMDEGTKPGIWITTGPGALTQGLKEVLMATGPERTEILKEVYIYDGSTHFEFVGQANPLHYKTTVAGHWGNAER